MSLCADEPTSKGFKHRVALPAPFSDALYTGLQMWVQDVAKDHYTLAWDAIPSGAGNVSLRWDQVNRKTEMETKIFRSLQTTQLGEKNIQEILRHVSETLKNPESPTWSAQGEKAFAS